MIQYEYMWPFNKSIQPISFLAVGDVFNDTFIELEDAHVYCNINNEDCTISMKFGDKLPYKKSTLVRAVGNAGNAAVAASRIDIPSGLITITGKDFDGDYIVETFKKEHVSDLFITQQSILPTNNAYVLQFGPERTILVKQATYDYKLPTAQLTKKKPHWIYFTSICNNTENFHNDLAEWIKENPDVNLAFQPGTFQMKMGTEKLKTIYACTKIFFCNKEEAQRILEKPHADFAELHTGIRALGPEYVVITDGPNGLTASHTNETIWKLPMYPDPQPPVDRTGAGDACSSTIVAMMQLGVSFEEALRYGPINSMNVVQYIGAQEGLLSREQLETYLHNAPSDYVLTQL